jgi:hypothetical protein
MADEKKKPGRPPGTVESLESLARDGAKEDLKIAAQARAARKAQIPKILEAMGKLSLDKPDELERYHTLSSMLGEIQSDCIKSVAPVAKVASQPTKIEDEGVSEDLRAKAFLAELKGEAV